MPSYWWVCPAFKPVERRVCPADRSGHC
ncbi:hypothetical protein GGQ11_002927 [Salinibacter ruber]|nr:hypothetical protein [Salinibacter ruber]MCS3824029.1 hypothetical protein [Salinibacter ruber]